MNGHKNNATFSFGWLKPGMHALCMLLNIVIVLWFLRTRSGEVIHNIHVIDMLTMVGANFHGPKYADYLFYNLSSKLIWAPLIVSIIYVILKGSKNKRQAIVLILVSVAIVALCDQVSGVIKRVVERPRPSHNDEISYLLHYVNNYHGGRFGFVSSHAANCFGESVWLMLLLRRRAVNVVLFCFSILVCYSRIYLGVHYPVDVLAGAVLGNIIGALVYAICVKFMGQTACIIPDRHNLVPAAAIATLIIIAVISMFSVFI